MTQEELKKLLDEMKLLPSETEWVEFKEAEFFRPKQALEGHYYGRDGESLGALNLEEIEHMIKQLKIRHVSVASQDVQARRINKMIPGGRKLHDYVNIYLNARNPMLYVLLDQQRKLCILRIEKRVLQLRNAIVSDRNAARQSRQDIYRCHQSI